MRFFKAFNILHRRTKSATFVPGPPPDLTSANTRTLSFGYYNGRHTAQQINKTSPSLFDLATTKAPPIPPHFNHISDRAPSLWRAKRQSGRTSMASVQSTMEKEHTRLREAINFWILEHSKLQSILNNCHAELVAERRKVLTLEGKINSDSQVMVGMRKDLSRYERLAGKTRMQFDDDLADISPSDSCGEETQLPYLQVESAMPQTFISREPRLTSGLPTKFRTVDEYSSALRMTLATRKELRDQKKVTKFWKSEALVNTQHAVITPSVSAISSIKGQALSAERQAALSALIIRRGLTSKLLPVPLAEPISSSNALRTMISTLPSSISKISTCSRQSRLGPLASESMKAEINFMFGSRDSLKRLSTPPRKTRVGLDYTPSSAGFRKSPSSTSKDSKEASPSLYIESFGDLNAIFNRTFGSGAPSNRQDIVLNKNDGSLRSPELGSTSFVLGIPGSSSSSIPIASLPSGSSQIFGEHFIIQNVTTGIKTKEMTPQPSMKQASKDCTPRRSWQMYITKATAPSKTGIDEKMSPQSAITQRFTKGKENNPLAMSLPGFKKLSRLPVPVFSKRKIEISGWSEFELVD